MSTQFRPIEIPPGVVALPTKQMRSSNWAEVNLMRWVEGRLCPIGGQAQYTYQFASRCKAVHSFYDLDGVFYIAYLCETNLYVDVGGTLYDITPGGGIAAPIPLTEGGYGEGPYSDGTYGTPRAISTVDSLDKVPDAFSIDNFGAILLAMTSPDGRLLQWDPGNGFPGVVFTDPIWNPFIIGQTTISMTDANDGSVTPGMNVFNTISGLEVGTVASYDNAGLLTLTAGALSSSIGNDILQFGNVAVPVVAEPRFDVDNNPLPNVVPYGRCFVVTNERFVMMFGAYDNINGGSFRRFAWCDQENFYAWDYSNITSQAGYLDVEPSSPIIAAVAGPLGVLMWTATRTYLNAFQGLPYIYNYTEIAKNCTPWSPQSIVPTSTLTLWFSQQGMFSYNGAWVQPVPCKVRPWIDADVDILNVREQACAVHVSPFSEFWWFFPQGVVNNPSGYNTRCVIYNYRDGWWSMGQMSRSAGVAASYTVQTIMADGLNAYEHEIGVVYPANVPLPWAETFDLNLTSGSKLVTVKQMIPDIGGDAANLLYSLFYKNSRSVMPGPNGPVPVVEAQTGQIAVNTSNGFLDLRTTGRDVRLRISLKGPQVNPVTVGQHLVDSVPRGDR
jgi:hypothetical protein